MATDAKALFAGSSHAAAYAKLRPKTPPALVNRVMQFLKQKLSPPYSLAVDVGCGSGQSSGVFSSHFEQLLGVDVSEAQIKEAEKNKTHANMSFRMGSSSNIPAANSTAQLITAACAIHWFDISEFYQEVERVLTPGGVLAVFSYRFPTIADCAKKDELQKHLQEVYDVLEDHWDARCAVLDNEYQDVNAPYEDAVRETVVDYMQLTVEQLSGLIQTWSAFPTLLRQDKTKAEESMSRFEEKMKNTLGPEEQKFTIAMKYFLIMARKPI